MLPVRAGSVALGQFPLSPWGYQNGDLFLGVSIGREDVLHSSGALAEGIGVSFVF